MPRSAGNARLSSLAAEEEHPETREDSEVVLAPPPAASARDGVTNTDTILWGHDQAGRRMVNQYARIDEIGQGEHGKVWLCEDTSVDGPPRYLVSPIVPSIPSGLGLI